MLIVLWLTEVSPFILVLVIPIVLFLIEGIIFLRRVVLVIVKSDLL